MDAVLEGLVAMFSLVPLRLSDFDHLGELKLRSWPCREWDMRKLLNLESTFVEDQVLSKVLQNINLMATLLFLFLFYI